MASSSMVGQSVQIDPADGLPASKAQTWAEEKHDALRRYLDISHPTRRKFVTGAGATYTELFSGPGRCFIKGTRKFIDGSPLVAYKEAQRTRTDFTSIHLADEQQPWCEAVDKRLRTIGAKPNIYPLRAEEAARAIAAKLDAYALHFAFLDPYNLGDLPLTLFEAFAPLRRIDILVHVSAMDLNRELPRSMTAHSAPLDTFAPGWRDAVGDLKAGLEARAKIIEHWLGRIRALGFKDARVWKLIRGETNQPLYWLVLVAKHPLATAFWDTVNRPPQDELF